MYQTLVLMEEIARQRAEQIERDMRQRAGHGRRRTRG
jgi:hypothetical protein